MHYLIITFLLLSLLNAPIFAEEQATPAPAAETPPPPPAGTETPPPPPPAQPPATEEPKIPLPSSLSLNVYNLTGYKAVVALHASEKGNKVHVVIAQNTVLKNSNLTLAKYFSPKELTYELTDNSVIIYLGDEFTQKLTCEVKGKTPPETDPKAKPEIKKTIDLFLYSAAKAAPQCAIFFDYEPPAA